MIIKEEDLNKIDFQLMDIAVYHVDSSDNKTSNTLNGRINSGFVYMLSNSHFFKPLQGENFTLDTGRVLYLPKYSKYAHTAVRYPGNTDKISIIVVNFQLTDNEGNNLMFSENPILIETVDTVVVKNIFNKLHREYFKTNSSQLKLKSHLLSLFNIFYSKQEPPKNSLDYYILEPVINYFNENHILNVKISDLAGMCFISENIFRKIFKRHYGELPQEYVNRVKMEHAVSLMKNSALSVSEINDVLGYNSPSYFAWVFKKHTGKSPGEYKKLINEARKIDNK